MALRNGVVIQFRCTEIHKKFTDFPEACSQAFVKLFNVYPQEFLRIHRVLRIFPQCYPQGCFEQFGGIFQKKQQRI